MEELKTLLHEVVEPKFYSIKQVAAIIGWSEKTVQELFNSKEFPSTNFGKEKKVERTAMLKYFGSPRRRER